jgi:hypothetical protein
MKDCQEIKHVYYDEYNKDSNKNINSDNTVYLMSNPHISVLAYPTTSTTTYHLCHDTGTPLHLFNNAALFSQLTYHLPQHHPSAALGDDKTLLPILGFGIADFIIQHKCIHLKAHYVPAMGTNLYSPTEHIKFQDCTYTLAHNTMFAKYPTFKLILPALDQFSCEITPSHDASQPVDFDFNYL